MSPSRISASILCALVVAGCGGSDAVPGFSRAVGPNGWTVVSYADGLPERSDTLVPLFTIGKYLNDSSRIFSDLRDLDIGPDGRIYALDYKTSTIAVFDSTGNRVATLGGPGEGPGEISRANGIRFGPDGTLWVNDHGKNMILALDADGIERARYPSLVPGFGYRWSVVIDTAGVLWEKWSRSLGGPRTTLDIDKSGPIESRLRHMFKGFDPATGSRDSIELDTAPTRMYVARFGGGGMTTGLPFAGQHLEVMDHHDRVWISLPDSYTLFRTTTAGDTTLELQVAEPGLPVTDADIAEWKTGFKGYADRIPTLISDMMEYMPERKPPIMGMFIDDRDRLWINRTVADGELARWDVYSVEGEFLESVRAAGDVSQWFQPMVRRGRIYLVAEGEAGERYVVVAGVGRMGPES